MKVLVVGGAGYIGSFVGRMLNERGYETIVLDNLSLGHRASVENGIALQVGHLSDTAFLMDLFQSSKIDAVMHFAAFALVGESMEAPYRYYRNNVANTVNLLSAMKENGVDKFIFSSTAAVFGNPEEIPIVETHPRRPINPYGRSKHMVEQIIEDAAEAYGLRYVSLRYFNAAGAWPDGAMGEDHLEETHLIPLVLRAILNKKGGDEPLRIFGTDYDTPDGTCIRDYIHVLDLAEAHILALEYLSEGNPNQKFNLGNGKGFSVLEVIRTAEKVTGTSVPVTEAERRAGDPPVLVAGSEKISRVLGWKSRYADIETIVKTAWKWHSGHPHGYGD